MKKNYVLMKFKKPASKRKPEMVREPIYTKILFRIPFPDFRLYNLTHSI